MSLELHLKFFHTDTRLPNISSTSGFLESDNFSPNLTRHIIITIIFSETQVDPTNSRHVRSNTPQGFDAAIEDLEIFPRHGKHPETTLRANIRVYAAMNDRLFAYLRSGGRAECRQLFVRLITPMSQLSCQLYFSYISHCGHHHVYHTRRNQHAPVIFPLKI